MRTSSVLLTSVFLCLLLFNTGCDTVNDESGTVTLTGRVVRADGAPIEGALVTVPAGEDMASRDDLTTQTDAEGRYELDVDIERDTELQVRVLKNGRTAEAHVTVLAGQEKEVRTLELNLSEEETQPRSGRPSNILLLEQSAQSIGVLESGSKEVAQLTYQVTDSTGRPVTLDNEAHVRFSFGQQPGGGEFIAPTEASTDNNGKVNVNLSSGTRAGIVQVVAEVDTGDRTIRSKPISVAIHGGLPDQDHFTLGPTQFNFPALLQFGLSNEISVIVGDKYGNPVKPGTGVYFTTDYGVIEGSAATDAQGRGTVTLLSGQPLPPDGVAVVEAETADENEQRVFGRTPVLFTGRPVITVSPTTAALGQTYSLTVTDPNGNPLAAGTTISVLAEGTKVKAVGNTGVTLDDTVFEGGLAYENVQRGPGITEFTFRAVEDQEVDEDGTPTIETITINVSGPNGTLEVVLTRDGTVSSRMDNAVIQEREREAVVRLTD